MGVWGVELVWGWWALGVDWERGADERTPSSEERTCVATKRMVAMLACLRCGWGWGRGWIGLDWIVSRAVVVVTRHNTCHCAKCKLGEAACVCRDLTSI